MLYFAELVGFKSEKSFEQLDDSQLSDRHCPIKMQEKKSVLKDQLLGSGSEFGSSFMKITMKKPRMNRAEINCQPLPKYSG